MIITITNRETMVETETRFPSYNNNTYDVEIVEINEVSIDGGRSRAVVTTDQQTKNLLGIRILKGKSVVTLSNMFSTEEISYVVQASIQCASSQTIQIDADDRVGRVCIRMPTQSAARRGDIPDAGTNDLHDPLPEDVSDFLQDRVLYRILSYIDRNLSDMVQTLFGYNCSLCQLYADEELSWSSREPAINVYYPPSGHFGIHKDNKALTILMPLSNGGGRDFSGGGTAFWSQSHPNEHRHDPSLVLTPAAGTVLLFGGRVPHKGLIVQSGMRVVFVASFGRISKENQRNTWLVSAR